MSEKLKAMAEKATILRCLVGSKAYGLGGDASDRDEKGVCLEPVEYALPLNGTFEQYEFRTAAERTGKSDSKSEPGDLDLTIYSLRKFLRLATYGNPNVVELLFIGGDCLLERNRIGEELQSLYPSIVSREAGRRYLGYMEAQKQRLLGERGQMRVTRTDLIDKYGYDTKYASHVVRLGFQGRELLETGKLILPMSGSDLEFTAAVKFGKIQLDEVLTTVGDLELQIKDLIKDGPLQDRPDYARVEEWMQAQYLDAWAPQSSGNWMGIVE
jgi:predicted nucleotidyltransferase